MQHPMTGHRLGVAEELSVTSGGSTILADGSVSFGQTETTRGGGAHSHRHHGGGSMRGGKRNLSMKPLRRGGVGADRRGPSMAGYGRGQFSMLDTNDSAALDKAAAILANDDFLEAATMSLSGAGGREYGAPSVLFSAPIRPNSPERGSRLGVSASTPGLNTASAGNAMSSNTTTQASESGEDHQLWAARTNRIGNAGNGSNMPPRGRGGAQSMSALPSSKSASTKTDADSHHHTTKKKVPLQFGAGEAPLAVSRSLDGTWHQVGIVAAPYERPATRREILALEHRYNAICEFARMALKEGGNDGGGGGGKDAQQQDPTGFADLLEQELMNTKQELMHMFTPLTGKGHASEGAVAAVTDMISGAARAEEGVDVQWRKPLTATIFEQKWTDMVLGELQEQIGVSCMEQGRLLFALRKRYAQAFNTMQEANADMMKRLATGRNQRERLGQILVDTKAQLGIHEEQAALEQEQALEAKELELRLEIDGERKKAEEAKQQQQRTQDTLRTLNGIFLQMQRDADGSTKADLRDAVTTMERRLYEREKELTELRPMRAGYDEMAQKIRLQEEKIIELTKDLQNAKDDVAQRDAMVAELMRQQGERLSQEELAKAKGGGGGGGGNAAGSGVSASGATTAMGQPVPESAVRVEGLVKDVDKLLGGTVKKRLPCAGYRLLLPNLMGYRPERPRRWTLRCMRSIMRAKQLDDSRCERSGQLRTRFPDFVYAWFEPPAHVLVGADSGEAREAIMAEADEDRWGLYYGVKALSRELPEARLFYNFLDEKYGEDELTFFLYCLRVLDAEAWRKDNGGIDWGRPYWMTPMNNATIAGADGGKTAGEGAAHGGGHQHDTSGMTSDGAGNELAPTSLERINTILRRQKEDGVEEDDEDDDDLRESDPDAFCPTVVFITQQTVKAVLDVVMKRSGGSANESEEVKNALFRNLIRKTAPVEVGRLPESVATVTKRRLTTQLNMLSSEVRKNMATKRGEEEEEGADGAAAKDAFDISEEDEAALEAEKKRFKETVQCVEAGGLLRGLLQEYREEQAHRRAAIRLMFQTATNPGADAAADVAVAGDADGSAGAAAGGGASTAAVDMQQFRSMCESLHSRVSFSEVVALYRDAYEIGGGGHDGGTGKGVVDFDSFSAAADNRQFFSACLRLPGFVGAAERNAEQMGLDMMRAKIGELQVQLDGGGGGAENDDSDEEVVHSNASGGGGGSSNPQSSASSQLSQGFSMEECSRLAAVVSRHVKLFETTIEEHYLAKALPGEARVRVQHQLDALREDIRQSCSGLAPDGRRALCSYRRLLDTLMYERMERLQQIGDNKIPGEVSGSRLDRIDRELDGVETILREFTVAPGVMKLRRVIRFLAVVRIQRCWRSYLAKSAGVPLSLRSMMTKEFTAPDPASLTLRTEAWLLQQLDTLYHEKLMSDARCDAARLPRVDFAAFLYDHHLYKFGVRQIAENNLHTLFFNVRKYAGRPSCSRAKIFALQTGMGDDLNLSIESRFRVGSDSSARAARQAATMVGATMTPERWMETRFSLEFYLRCVISLAAASTANRSGLYPYSRQEENTGHSSLPLDQACEVLASTLGKDHAGANVHFSESEIVVLQSRAKDMARGASGGAGGDSSRINVDDLLELVMCRWATKMRDREVELRKIFRAGDVDLNNILSFDEFYEMSHSREIKFSFSMDDDHILALFRKAAHLSDPEEAIDVDSFITVLMHDPEIAQALANSPMKDIDEHSTQVAYSAAIAKVDSQPMIWLAPGASAKSMNGSENDGGALVITKTDNSLAVNQLSEVWDESYADSLASIIDELEEVAVPIDDSAAAAPQTGGQKKARSRTVTTADVKQLRLQLEKVSEAIEGAKTMMTTQSLAAAWTSLRRMLARVHKAKAKAGIKIVW